MKIAVMISVIGLALLGFLVSIQAGSHTYGKVYHASTDDFYEYKKVGPYQVDSTGRMKVTVMWDAKKKGLFARNKVTVYLEVFQKPGGHTSLKERIKKNAAFDGEMSVSFRVNQSTLNRSRLIFFRVCEKIPVSGDEINITAASGNRHKINYKIRVEWTPDH